MEEKISSLYDKKLPKYKNYLNPYLIKYIPDKSRVLDIGCSNGFQGKYLRKKKNCIVYGIDISPQAIKKAQQNLDKAEVMDISKDKFPFSKEKFDVIVFSDILEHLAWPEKILKKLKKYLKKDGLIVAAIPNVANLKIRLRLLLGKWDYQELGILDKTHLRFFTQKTTRQLFENCGLKITKEGCSPEFSFLPCKIYPSLLSRHIIIVAKKSNQ